MLVVWLYQSMRTKLINRYCAVVIDLELGWTQNKSNLSVSTSTTLKQVYAITNDTVTDFSWVLAWLCWKILNAQAFNGNSCRNVSFILQTTEYDKQKVTLSDMMFLASFIC